MKPKPEPLTKKVNVIDVKYEPHPGQALFHQSETRFRIACTGRKWGKTEMLIWEAFDWLGRPNTLIWWVAPFYSVADLGWRRFNQKIPRLTIKKTNRREFRIEMINGSQLYFKSADNPDALHGEGIDLLILDEAARIRERVWLETLRPNLSDPERIGHMCAVSTPKGHNWFYKEWMKGLRHESNYEAWGEPLRQLPLIKEPIEDIQGGYPSWRNPYFKLSELYEAMKLPLRVFLQEYGARFLEDLGAIFQNVRGAVKGKPMPPRPEESYYIGADLGKAESYTVAIVLDSSGQVVAMERYRRKRWTTQVRDIIRLAKEYNEATISIDSTGLGDPIYDFIKERYPHIRSVKLTTQRKTKLIDNLALLIQTSRITYPEEYAPLIEELSLFGAGQTATGTIKYSAPRGFHDDCLKAGTMIKTLSGYRPIESIKPGDLVFTHKARYRPVEKCIKKPFDGRFYSFNFNCQLPLDLSYNHPIYAASQSWIGNKCGPWNRRRWVLPEHWRKTYRCVTPIEALEPSKTAALAEADYYINPKAATNNKLRRISLDENFSRFLGRFLADGWCSNSGIYRLGLAFNKRENEIEWYHRYLRDLGISVSNRNLGHECRTLNFNSKLLWHILRKCYNPNGEKILPPFAKTLGQSLKECLEGWLEGDGWFTPWDGGRSAATTSKALALDMRDIAWSLGFYSSIRRISRNRYGIPTKPQYWVHVAEHRPQRHQKTISNFEFGSRQIRPIRTYRYIGSVYNLQVAEDRSFVADGIVLHNCVLALALAAWQLHRNPQALGFEFFTLS